MNPNTLDASMLRLASGWDTAVWPRTCFALFGALMLILTVRVIWKKDCSALAGALWLIIGAACVAFSIVPQTIVDTVMRTDYISRIRIIMGLFSIIVLLTTLESIRCTRLQERYALLWVATGGVLLFCTVFPQAVDFFRAVTGMQYGTAVAAVAFTFLVLVAFHFSISMSGMEADRDKLAQKLAVLEARLKELEQKTAPRRADAGGPADPQKK